MSKPQDPSENCFIQEGNYILYSLYRRKSIEFSQGKGIHQPKA